MGISSSWLHSPSLLPEPSAASAPWSPSRVTLETPGLPPRSPRSPPPSSPSPTDTRLRLPPPETLRPPSLPPRLRWLHLSSHYREPRLQHLEVCCRCHYFFYHRYHRSEGRLGRPRYLEACRWICSCRCRNRHYRRRH